MSKKRLQGIIVLILIIGISAFIWYKDQSPVIPPPPPDNGGQTDQNDNGITEAKKYGGTYTAAISAPPHLDPNKSTSEELTDITINIYEGLYELDANYRPVPALATSCDISEDGKKYTFKLRQEVRFHDGSTMTAEDVLASFEYWLLYGNSADIRNKIVGYGISEKNNLFYIQLKQVYTPFLSRLANYEDNQRLVIMPKEVAVTGNEDTLIEIPCGTGPYKFTEWIPGQHCKLTRFDEYTPFLEVPSSGASGRKTAYFNNIVFEFIEDTASRLAGLKSNVLDFAGKITPDEYEVLSDDPTVHAIMGSLKEQNMFIFNSGIPPFNDVNARLAVLYGIDIDAIAEIAVSTNRSYWAAEASLFGSSSSWAVPEAGESVYNTHDIEKAKEYLAKADYDNRSVILIVDSQDTTEFMATQILQSQLEEIGFATKLITLDAGALSDLSSGLNGWNIYVTTLNTTYYDPMAYASLINKDAWVTHWNDSDAVAMENIYTTLAQETDTVNRREAVKEWNALFYRSAPAIKSFSFKSAYLFNTRVDSTWLNQMGIIPEGIAFNTWFKEDSSTVISTEPSPE